MISDFKLFVEQEDVLEELRNLEVVNGATFLYILETIGWDTISFLRSNIGGTAPPIGTQRRTNKGGFEYSYTPPRGRAEGPRQAHPGGWADVTANLANAYRFEIWSNGIRVRWTQPPVPIDPNATTAAPVEPLIMQGMVPKTPRPPFQLAFLNDMDYAAALEAMDGYFVITEVTMPGGPVDRALRASIAAVPGWEIIG